MKAVANFIDNSLYDGLTDEAHKFKSYLLRSGL